jgi:3',5'-cyclic AMP phosphodiesterase CpdA
MEVEKSRFAVENRAAAEDLAAIERKHMYNYVKNCKNAKFSALYNLPGSHVHVLVKPNFFHNQFRNDRLLFYQNYYRKTIH